MPLDTGGLEARRQVRVKRLRLRFYPPLRADLIMASINREPSHMPFHVIFYTVAAITLLSGTMATALAVFARGRRIPYKRTLVERFSCSPC